MSGRMRAVFYGIGLYLMIVALLIFAANFSTSKFIYVDF